MKLSRLLAAAAALALAASTAGAQQFFRIGTGGTAGTYFPVGGMIANTVSQPGKISATAQSSAGSVANVNAVPAASSSRASRRPMSPPGPTPARASGRAGPRSPGFA